MTEVSFAAEVAHNQSRERVEDPRFVTLSSGGASLVLREQGLFIVEGKFVSPSSGELVDVFYADEAMDISKLPASHVMSPVGPHDGIGGQHGFPRWADYRHDPMAGGSDGEARTSFQSIRSDGGEYIVKALELRSNGLESRTTLYNPGVEQLATSVGEHYYFRLDDEDFDGLQVNGMSLDELLGDGGEDAVKSGEPRFWSEYSGRAAITMPRGYELHIGASASDELASELGMLVWHRSETESICFEPTLGMSAAEFGAGDGGYSLQVPQYGSATLETQVRLR